MCIDQIEEEVWQFDWICTNLFCMFIFQIYTFCWLYVTHNKRPLQFLISFVKWLLCICTFRPKSIIALHCIDDVYFWHNANSCINNRLGYLHWNHNYSHRKKNEIKNFRFGFYFTRTSIIQIFAHKFSSEFFFFHKSEFCTEFFLNQMAMQGLHLTCLVTVYHSIWRHFPVDLQPTYSHLAEGH